MTENQNQIVVTRTVNAPAQDIFDVLTDPARHRELDGSGFIRSDQQAQRITGTGQVFTMNMTGDHMGGDYQTDNHVTGYDENQLLAWQTAHAGARRRDARLGRRGLDSMRRDSCRPACASSLS